MTAWRSAFPVVSQDSGIRTPYCVPELRIEPSEESHWNRAIVAALVYAEPLLADAFGRLVGRYCSISFAVQISS